MVARARGSVLWLSLCVGMSLCLSGLLLHQQKLRKPLVCLLLLSMAAASPYGWIREVAHPAYVPAPMEQRVSLVASVTTTEVKGDWEIVFLKVQAVETPFGNRRCRASAVWVPGARDRLPYHRGEVLYLNGFLARDTSNKPVTTWMRWLSPEVKFIGTLQSSQVASGNLSLFMQRQLANSLSSVAPSGKRSETSLLVAFLVGDTESDEAIKRLFLEAGILHVITANGTNLMLLLEVLHRLESPLYRAVPKWNQRRTPVIFLIVGAYVVLCGGTVSIVRAAVMAVHRLLGEACGRRPRAHASLAVAAWTMAVAVPSRTLSATAILSFVAVGAVLQGLPRAGQRDRHRPWWFRFFRRLVWLARVTVIVELYLEPLTVALFAQWTPYAALTNWLADPILVLLVGPLLVFSGLALLVPVLPFVKVPAQMLGVALTAVVGALVRGLKMVVAWPHALVVVHPPNLAWFILYYGVLSGVLLLRTRARVFVRRFWRRLHTPSPSSDALSNAIGKEKS
jgi:ComEC/Rec2-related protein